MAGILSRWGGEATAFARSQHRGKDDLTSPIQILGVPTLFGHHKTFKKGYLHDSHNVKLEVSAKSLGSTTDVCSAINQCKGQEDKKIMNIL